MSDHSPFSRRVSLSRRLSELIDLLECTGCAPRWSEWRNCRLAHCPGDPEHELSLRCDENGSVEIECSGCGSESNCCHALGMRLFAPEPFAWLATKAR
jgi:hypothetical protein